MSTPNDDFDLLPSLDGKKTQEGLETAENSNMAANMADALQENGSSQDGSQNGQADLTSIEVIHGPDSPSMDPPDLSGLKMDSSVELPVAAMVESQSTDDGKQVDGQEEDPDDVRQKQDRGDDDDDEAEILERDDVPDVGADVPVPENEEETKIDDITELKDKVEDQQEDAEEPHRDDDDDKPVEDEERLVEELGPLEEQNEDESEEEESPPKKSGTSKIVLVLFLLAGTGVALAIAPTVFDINVQQHAILVRDHVQEMFTAVPAKIKDTIAKVKPVLDESAPRKNEADKKKAEEEAKREAERRKLEEEKRRAEEEKRQQEEAAKIRKFMLFVGATVVVIVVVIGTVVYITCAPSDNQNQRIRDRKKVNVRRVPQEGGRQRREDLKRRK